MPPGHDHDDGDDGACSSNVELDGQNSCTSQDEDTDEEEHQGRSMQNIEETWPLRLLHVETMESVPRILDSTSVYYGDDERPAYNIISYTWGRWEDLTYGEAICVTGPGKRPLEWQVPKIRPDKAFGADDFESVLRKVAADVNFVWVDVACINQNSEAPESAIEIGRQAGIFHRAEQGYIWLHQTTARQIQDSISLMVRIRDDGQRTRTAANQQPRYLHNIEQRKADCETVGCLLEDPWFSSLWTLQEAYIKKDAIFLSKEGRTVTHADQDLTISALATLCTEVFPWIWQPTKTLIKSAGLNQLQARNPFALLSISSRRTTKRQEDRIYGIMQIFGFKLGKTAVNSNRDVYQLRELEEQLSQRLMMEIPTLSQMFLHRDQRPEGREMYHTIGTQTRDRNFSRHGAIRPGLDLTLFVPEEFWHAKQVESSCRFAFGHQPGVKVCGTLLRLASIVDMWIDEDGEPESVPVMVYPDEGKTPEMNRFDRSLWLDHFSGVDAEGVTPVADLNMASFTRPVVVARSMVMRYPDQFYVLDLGKIRNGQDHGKQDVQAGLLIRKIRSKGRFRRVGFCTWLSVRKMEGEEREVYL